jgi:hypothetical protein
MALIKQTLDALITEAERLPFQGSINVMHRQFRRLVEGGFLLPDEPWLNAFELASLAKLIYMHGHGRQWQSFDLQFALNAFKKIWSLAESEGSDAPYSDDSEQIACFALRFVYQQAPFNLDAARMNQNFRRTQALFSEQSETAKNLRGAFEKAAGVNIDIFLKVARAMYAVFVRQSHLPKYDVEKALEKYSSRESVARSIRVLTASRGQFRKYYEKYQAVLPWQVPYEFNPLLRFPVLSHNDQYWCVYPELINYAATRGLYFYLADAIGGDFFKAFADAFEDYVARRCIDKFGRENVITEQDERLQGWQSKTNDITVLIGDSALLLECKNSGLFALAKRSANPQELGTDARKNLVNSKHRQGIYQLHDKIASIRAGELPGPLAERYSRIRNFFPVILLHDEISFANRPECLKNIIDKELRSNGVADFEYQIWHVEELESLITLISPDNIQPVIAEKFRDDDSRTIDLSAYLAKKTGLERLRLHLFMPAGDTKAWRILRGLSEQDQAQKNVVK